MNIPIKKATANVISILVMLISLLKLLANDFLIMSEKVVADSVEVVVAVVAVVVVAVEAAANKLFIRNPPKCFLCYIFCK
ncbi:hypothetical protein D3C77_749150 [compost metagenome]